MKQKKVEDRHAGADAGAGADPETSAPKGGGRSAATQLTLQTGIFYSPRGFTVAKMAHIARRPVPRHLARRPVREQVN